MAGRGGPMKPSMKLGYEFNVEEENFIVRMYHEKKTDIEVKRAFRKQFGQSALLAKTPPHHFHRVYERFQKKGNYFHSLTNSMPAFEVVIYLFTSFGIYEEKEFFEK